MTGPVFLLGPIEQLSLTDFDRSVAVNVRAPFVAAQAAVPTPADVAATVRSKPGRAAAT